MFRLIDYIFYRNIFFFFNKQKRIVALRAIFKLARRLISPHSSLLARQKSVANIFL